MRSEPRSFPAGTGAAISVAAILILVVSMAGGLVIASVLHLLLSIGGGGEVTNLLVNLLYVLEMPLLAVALEQKPELRLEGMSRGILVEFPEEAVLLDLFEEQRVHGVLISPLGDAVPRRRRCPPRRRPDPPGDRGAEPQEADQGRPGGRPRG